MGTKISIAKSCNFVWIITLVDLIYCFKIDSTVSFPHVVEILCCKRPTSVNDPSAGSPTETLLRLLLLLDATI